MILKKIWDYIFKEELKVDPSEYNIIFTQPLMSSKNEKEKIAEIMFENFNAPSLYLAYSIDLSFYSSGKESGLFIDLGGNSTQISAFLNDLPIPCKFERLYYGGNAITDYLCNIFHQNVKKYYNDKNKIIVENIKEKACYVALNYEEEKVEPYHYDLLDNTDLIIEKERIQAPEVLFKPSLITKEDIGLHQACNKIIENCGDDIKKILYNNIYLSGGNSLLEGLNARLAKEIKNIPLYSFEEEVNVISQFYGQFSTWIGGEMISELSTFNDIKINYEMYQDSGSSIIYKNDNYMLK